jgi:hypothetical protein
VESSCCLHFHGTINEGETVVQHYPAYVTVISMRYFRPWVKSLS